MSSVATRLSRLEKGVHKIRGQLGKHAEPGQLLWQNKPESTLTSQAQYKALAIDLWSELYKILTTTLTYLLDDGTAYYFFFLSTTLALMCMLGL